MISKWWKNKNVIPHTKISKSTMKVLRSNLISLKTVQKALILQKRFNLNFLKPKNGFNQTITLEWWLSFTNWKNLWKEASYLKVCLLRDSLFLNYFKYLQLLVKMTMLLNNFSLLKKRWKGLELILKTYLERKIFSMLFEWLRPRYRLMGWH